VRAELLPIILRQLGFRTVPGGGLAPEMFGPPAPAMLTQIRRRRPVVAAPQPGTVEARGPFAALAALKR
jgi:hypothetical protein